MENEWKRESLRPIITARNGKLLLLARRFITIPCDAWPRAARNEQEAQQQQYFPIEISII